MIFHFLYLGNKIAFVGETGSGKSTILKLSMGMYDPNYGVVKICGLQLDSTTKLTLKNRISVAFQETVLFNTSILENIIFSNREATDEMIELAIKTACLEDVIKKLPLGIHSIIGDGGMLISGGERQRIGIARMLLKESEIFIMDEATSSLDNKTEKSNAKHI